MFTQKDIKDYLAIKNEVRVNGYLLISLTIACFICAATGYEILDIPASSLGIIGFFVGLQSLSYFTSKFGSGRACELLHKAISSDPEGIRILAEIKRSNQRRTD